MAILIITEHNKQEFKKTTFEISSYASQIGKNTGEKIIALVFNSIEKSEIAKLGTFGVEKVIYSKHTQFNDCDNRLVVDLIEQVVKSNDIELIVFANSAFSKSIAPRLSVRLKAGFISNVVSLPCNYEPLIFEKKVFSAKAFSQIQITTNIKIISLARNCFSMSENCKPIEIQEFKFSKEKNISNFDIIETQAIDRKILLNEAEIVVSGGRGMGGKDKWQPLEELATQLNAALACSRPVSDENWRPHHEHVGQTGKSVSPNLYIACGISGAIQHFAGISSAKYILAINNDADAPIFDFAQFGIIGDVHEILPAFVRAVREYKGK